MMNGTTRSSYADTSAIVLGASMSGLLAARALSDHCRHVTIVERDLLTDHTEPRKGVPQSAHAHGLLASGYRVMDRYFPGLMEELRHRGAPVGDVVGDFLWFQYGHWKLRHESGLRGITVSRPCLEAAIRRRVRRLPNITILEGVSGVRPIFDTQTGRVTGLVVRRSPRHEQEFLAADLVVDAAGRGSHSPQWLEEWGFGKPEVVTVTVNVGYATRVFERRPGDLFDSNGAIVSGVPNSTRYGAVLAAEGNRWVITLVGTVGDYPPGDETGWLQFSASLPVPVVHELASRARPLTDIVSYRFQANQRRLYEHMKRFPDGYLVVGDALCSFNPVYGQGMSVVALEAEALDEELSAGMHGIAVRFYRRARKIIDIAWEIATGEDLRIPQVQGSRPIGFNAISRYLERVHTVAAYDRLVCRKFMDVLNLLASPTSLMSPRVAWRVFSPRGKSRNISSPLRSERHPR
jgi:2-polyprenyl-6-methoxyphenol hydroxylase-like FAD-dependent oxidoreductase